MDRKVKKALLKKGVRKKAKKKAKKKVTVLKSPEKIRFDEHPAGFDDNELFKKAYHCVDNLLNQANLQEDEDKQYRALNGLLIYMRAKALNSNAIIEIIAKSNAKQLKLIEASLKKEGILEDIKRGRATLQDVYQLPIIKKTRSSK